MNISVDLRHLFMYKTKRRKTPKQVTKGPKRLEHGKDLTESTCKG